jgi:hypothetical protein
VKISVLHPSDYRSTVATNLTTPFFFGDYDTCLLCNDVYQIHLAWQFMEDQNSNVSGYTQLNYLLNKGTIK